MEQTYHFSEWPRFSAVSKYVAGQVERLVSSSSNHVAESVRRSSRRKARGQ